MALVALWHLHTEELAEAYPFVWIFEATVIQRFRSMSAKKVDYFCLMKPIDLFVMSRVIRTYPKTSLSRMMEQAR